MSRSPTIGRALDLGVTFLDTAGIYGAARWGTYLT